MSVCQSLLVLDDRVKEGRLGIEIFFFFLHQQTFGPFGRNTATLPFPSQMQNVCVRVNAVRTVVSGADGETGFAYCGWRGGSESWTL